MRLILVICLLLSSVTFGADYKSAQRLAAGDVISADVFNDILDRIELTLKPIEVSELEGQWDAVQVYCVSGASIVGSANYCNEPDNLLGDATLVGGRLLKRTDTVTLTDNSDGTFSWTNNTRDMMFMFSNKDTMRPNTGGLEHVCYLSPTGVVACTLHSSMDHPVDGPVVNMMTVKRTSPDQIVFQQGPAVGGAGTVNFVILDKKGLPPESPSALTALLESNSVSLSWTANDENVTSYSIRSKDDALDDFTELNTSSTASFADILETGKSRWYRVFAINEHGTSIGSNVVKVDNPES